MDAPRVGVVGGGNGGVGCLGGGGGGFGDVASVQRYEAGDEPAGGLADEHLRGLQDGLLEGSVVPGVRVVAVADALVVLERLDVRNGGLGRGREGCVVRADLPGI